MTHYENQTYTSLAAAVGTCGNLDAGDLYLLCNPIE